MAKKDKQKLEISINQADDDASGKADWLGSDKEGQLLLDVFGDEENIYVKSTIAGVNPEDLEISIHNDMLTIRGKRSQETEVEEKDYFYQECYWGGFSRSIILPGEVKTDQISATLKDGVLIITLPKAERRRSIPIEVKED
jgi:HSP20 family protein